MVIDTCLSVLPSAYSEAGVAPVIEAESSAAWTLAGPGGSIARFSLAASREVDAGIVALASLECIVVAA
jgi:hypothetical protein